MSPARPILRTIENALVRNSTCSTSGVASCPGITTNRAGMARSSSYWDGRHRHALVHVSSAHSHTKAIDSSSAVVEALRELADALVDGSEHDFVPGKPGFHGPHAAIFSRREEGVAVTSSAGSAVDAVVHRCRCLRARARPARARCLRPCCRCARTSSSALAGSRSSSGRVDAHDGGRLEAEAREDVVGAGERRRAELEQCVRARGERRRDLARHREHLASLLEREVGGDQRAAALARLDDDRRRSEARDDAVARGESPRRRLDAGRVLRHDQPGLRDAPRELGVRGGVVAVDAAAEHGDGRRCRPRARRGAPRRRRRARAR